MRELIRRHEITTEKSEPLELRYYLLSQKSDSVFSSEACEGMVYGISVSAADVVGYSEASDVGITYIKNEAIDFIHELADAFVTPASFLSVVDEYVGEFW